MIDISYDKLFSVELLHKYSVDNACNDFTIIPSAATKQLLGNYRIQVRQIGNTLNAWINLDPAALTTSPSTKKPFIIPVEGLQLTFFMILNNPLFFNYTSLPAANNNGNIYYFTNRNINSSNGKKFLTCSLNNTAGTYSLEDLLVSGGSVYQSLKNSNSTADLTDKTSWRQIVYPDPNNPGLNITDLNRFMSSGDMLTSIPSVSQMSLATAVPVINVQLIGYNSTVISIPPINNPDNLPSFTLNLLGIDNGKYSLSINDGSQPRTIYLNDELRNTQVFGLIDIYIEGTLDTDYLILKQDADPLKNNQLNSPLYSIYFLNRATIWKYILNSNSTGQITAAGYDFPTTDANIIYSKFPIPLSQKPLSVSFQGIITNPPSPPSSVSISPVACATPERIIYDKPPFLEVSHCSEIFLNY